MQRMSGCLFAAIFAVVPLAVTAQSTSTGSGQAWPAKTVRIVVPFAAGGPADIYARAVAEKLQAALGQPFVVEDKPGGGSIVGTDAVAKSPPDGYTLLMMSNTHTVNESLIPDRPFQLMRDFVPVAPVNYSELVMVVHPSVPASSLKEFIALAKAKPGQLNYASSGPGTPYHMAGELFKAMAGVDIVHVPYKGSSGARTDILGGQVQMMFDAITTMAPNVQAGKLKALGTSGQVRSPVLPDVPTVSEAGVAGYEAVIWLGFMAPAGTPKAVVDKLNAEIRRIVAIPEIKAAWDKQGAVAMSMTPEEFGRFMREDIEKWSRIVKISGAKHAIEIDAAFGAVGAMLEKFLAGEPCDVLILTHAQIEELAGAGRVRAETIGGLGAVATSIAVRAADPAPFISDEAALRSTLSCADAFYFPDPVKSTAGIHFAGVLARLGLSEALAERFRTFPNGATAMRAMARASGRPIGCTQATEILATPGVRLVAPLPQGFALETVYAAAVTATAAQPDAARRFVEILSGESSRPVRSAAGFQT